MTLLLKQDTAFDIATAEPEGTFDLPTANVMPSGGDSTPPEFAPPSEDSFPFIGMLPYEEKKTFTLTRKMPPGERAIEAAKNLTQDPKALATMLAKFGLGSTMPVFKGMLSTIPEAPEETEFKQATSPYMMRAGMATIALVAGGPAGLVGYLTFLGAYNALDMLPTMSETELGKTITKEMPTTALAGAGIGNWQAKIPTKLAMDMVQEGAKFYLSMKAGGVVKAKFLEMASKKSPQAAIAEIRDHIMKHQDDAWATTKRLVPEGVAPSNHITEEQATQIAEKVWTDAMRKGGTVSQEFADKATFRAYNMAIKSTWQKALDMVKNQRGELLIPGKGDLPKLREILQKMKVSPEIAKLAEQGEWQALPSKVLEVLQKQMPYLFDLSERPQPTPTKPVKTPPAPPTAPKKGIVEGKEGVMYHQSQGDTGEFLQKGDKGYKKAGYSQAGEGIYFSPNKELVQSKYGKGGGKLVSVTLDIKNPLDLGDKDAMYFDGRKVSYGDVVVENFKREQRGEKPLPEPDIILQTISPEAKKWLLDNGYDAVTGMKGEMWSAPETVVFDKSKIKLTQPTKAPKKGIVAPKAGVKQTYRVAYDIGGKVYEGKVGEIHSQLFDRLPKNIQNQYYDDVANQGFMSGFVDKAGEFQTRGDIEMRTGKVPNIEVIEKGFVKQPTQAGVEAKVEIPKIVKPKPKAPEKKTAFEVASQKLADELNFGKKMATQKREARERITTKKFEQTRKNVTAKLNKAKTLSLPGDYNDRVDALLDQYDLSVRMKKTKLSRAKREEYLETLDDLVDISVLGKNFFKGIGKKTIDEMTLGELEHLESQVDAIIHAGKTKTKLIHRKEERDQAEVVDNIAKTVGSKTGYVPEKLKEGGILISDGEKASVFSRVKEGVDEFFSSIRKTEFVTDNLGISEHITDPVMESANEARTLKLEFNQKIKDAFMPLGDEVTNWYKPQKIDGVRVDLTMQQMVGVALNTGNVDNIARLLEGNQFTPEEVKIIRDKVMSNPKLKPVVESLWNILEDMRPYIANAFEAITGVKFKPVEGRYFPIMYDLKLKDLIKLNQDIATMQSTLIHSASVKFGSVEERRGTSGPVNLNFMEPLYVHIQKAIRYSSYADTIQYVNRILQDPIVRNVITGSMNEATLDSIETWLKRVANPWIVKGGELEPFINYLRYAATQYFLGANISVSAVQALSFFDAIDEIGLVNTLKGLGSFYGDVVTFKDVNKKVMDKSSYMKERYVDGSFDRELSDMISGKKFEKLILNREGLAKLLNIGPADVAKLFYIGITTIDYLTTMPTWIGAYEDGLRNFNGDEKKSIEYADKVARKTQPDAHIENLATMMSGGAWQRLWTTFMSYTSTHYNRLADVGFDLFKNKELSPSKKIVDAGVSLFWLIVPTTILFTYIKNALRKYPKDLELNDFLLGVVNNVAGGIPFARDVASGLIYKRRGLSPAPLSVFDMVMNLIDGKNKSKKAAEFIGFVTRIFPKPVVDLFFSGDAEPSGPKRKGTEPQRKGKSPERK